MWRGIGMAGIEPAILRPKRSVIPLYHIPLDIVFLLNLLLVFIKST